MENLAEQLMIDLLQGKYPAKYCNAEIFTCTSLNEIKQQVVAKLTAYQDVHKKDLILLGRPTQWPDNNYYYQRGKQLEKQDIIDEDFLFDLKGELVQALENLALVNLHLDDQDEIVERCWFEMYNNLINNQV